MKVPFVDLKAQYAAIGREVRRAMDEVLEDASGLILGKQVAELERAFADFSGVKACVTVGNGTDAIELALRALRIGPGDEVLVPTNSFIATGLAVLRAGATPVFVDCDEDTLLVDVDDAARRLTKQTRAIAPVHLFGQMASISRVTELARSANLAIVEDAAQAHGASQNGDVPGKHGRIATTSFYPTKNLGAYGDGGAVFTDDELVAERIRKLRNYGSEVKYHHPEIGFNSRLDTIQAAALQVKLRHLREWNEARRAAADRYFRLLADVPGVRLPGTLAGNVPVYHLFVVRVRNRDEIARRLGESGIATAVHYPVPIHLQGAFASDSARAGSLPVAETAAREILSLPIYPEITADQQEYVAAELARAVRSVG